MLFRDVITVSMSPSKDPSSHNSRNASGINGVSNISSSLGDMQAMVATQSTYDDDNCWFLDFGSTNHVTNNLGNLAISS